MAATILGATAGACIAPFIVDNIPSAIIGIAVGAVLGHQWKIHNTPSQKSDQTEPESKASSTIWTRAKDTFDRVKTNLLEESQIEKIHIAAIGMIALGAIVAGYGLSHPSELSDKVGHQNILRNVFLKMASVASPPLSEQHLLPSIGGALASLGLMTLLIGKGGITQKEDPLKRGIVWGSLGGIFMSGCFKAEAPPCTMAALWMLTFGLMGLTSGVSSSLKMENTTTEDSQEEYDLNGEDPKYERECLSYEHHRTVIALFAGTAAIATLVSDVLSGFKENCKNCIKTPETDKITVLCLITTVTMVMSQFAYKIATIRHHRHTTIALLGRVSIAAVLGAIVTTLTKVRFLGSLRAIGFLTGGALGLMQEIECVLNNTKQTQEAPKNSKRYREILKMLLGSSLALTVYDQVTDYQPENRVANIIASSILLPMGALLAKGIDRLYYSQIKE